MLKSISIYGVGLIGASAGLAYKRAHPKCTIVGYGRTEQNLLCAQDLGAIDTYSLDTNKPNNTELALIAAPPQVSLRLIQNLRATGFKGYVTDCTSTKLTFAEEAENSDWEGRFVPGHPIAGTENQGAKSAEVDLYQGATTVLCPSSDSNQTAVDVISGFWRDCGANISLMNPKEHDQQYAWVSHAPHAIVFALAHTMMEQYSADELARLSGGGLRGLLRLAKSTPEMWAAIFDQNSIEIDLVLDHFESQLKEIRQNLKSPERMRKILQEIRSYTDQYQSERNP